MDIEWLEDFLSFSNLSSFTRAAQERHVTQSAFSRRIRSLEDWIGTQLIDRDTVPPKLTAAGYLFREVARETVRNLQDTRLTLGQKKQAFSGIKLYVSHSLAQSFLSDWIAELWQRMINFQFDIHSVDTYEGLLALSSGRCDILMAYSSPLAPLPLDETLFPSIHLADDRLLPVSAPNADGSARYSLAERSDKPLPVLAFPMETFFGRLVNGIVRFSGENRKINTVMQSHNPMSLHTLALNGMGISWLPERLIRADLAAGKLVLAGNDSWCCQLQIKIYESQEKMNTLQPHVWESIKVMQESQNLLAQ
ncbi:MAG: LysR family transcriptional regulator [Pseudomonadota bacterium]